MKKSRYMLMSLVLCALAAPVSAQAPNLLNYQGHLTDPSGNPKNGTFTMQFAFYDAVSGGNQLPTSSPWSESQNVTVTNGVFNVLLGSVTALPAALFQGGPSDASGALRFLQVSVNGETLSPRNRIVSAAYTIQDPSLFDPLTWSFSSTSWSTTQVGSMNTASVSGGVLFLNLQGTVQGSLTGSVGSTNPPGMTVDFSKSIRARFVVHISSTDSHVYEKFLVGLADVNQTTTTSLTLNHFGMLINGSTVLCSNADGMTQTTTDVSSSVVVSRLNVFDLVFTPGVGVQFYVNGSLLATQTTHLPTSSAEPGTAFAYVGAYESTPIPNSVEVGPFVYQQSIF